MKALALIALVLLAGCVKPAERDERVVTEILVCSDGVGGWGGVAPSCRVVLDNGERKTVGRPVAVGDRVSCGKTYCWIQ